MAKPVQIDPLYIIFEQHLYNFQDSDMDRRTFVGNVVQDYLSYLRKLNISIPKSLEQPIVEELACQINTLLLKKIYGYLTIQDFQKHVPSRAKRRVKVQYSKICRKRVAKQKA